MIPIRIGTRSSALALAQTGLIVSALKKRHPRLRFETVRIKTEGDEFKSVELFKKNHIGVFTKEIERRLLDKTIDIAVHSLKDLPTRLARGLALAAVPKRASIADVLISRDRHTLKTLPPGSKVGTGSPRRKQQLMRLRPDLRVLDLRGNLDTRVSKVLHKKTLDGVVVARAGIERLKKFGKFWKELDPKTFLPAVGQGALAIQVRAKDARTKKVVASLNHPESERLTAVEREFLNRLQGGCRVPVGILSKKTGTRIRLKAAVFSVKTDAFVEASVERPWPGAMEAARELADILLEAGARKFLREARTA